MKIVTPMDNDFDFEGCKALYDEYSKYMGNLCNFDEIVSNSHFYSFYEKNKRLLGCIYINSEGGKLFLSGFSVRKNHYKNIDAVKKVLTFYNCPMYAKTKNLSAVLLLKKCGFKIIKTDKNMKYLKKEI